MAGSRHVLTIAESLAVSNPSNSGRVPDRQQAMRWYQKSSESWRTLRQQNALGGRVCRQGPLRWPGKSLPVSEIRGDHEWVPRPSPGVCRSVWGRPSC